MVWGQIMALLDKFSNRVANDVCAGCLGVERRQLHLEMCPLRDRQS